MATGSRPDPRRRNKGHQHATFLPVSNGQKDSGYKAGEVFGCYGHRTYAHQPCAAIITSNELQCPYCAAGVDLVWRGYVPLWDRDWSLRYVLIGEDIFDSVDVIPFRAQVVVSRAKPKISPLIVREEVSLTRQVPDREPWNKPVDMLEVCLTLWKVPELEKWIKAHPGALTGVGDMPVSLPKGTAKKGNGKPFSPMMQAAAKRNGAEVEPKPLAEEFPALAARIAQDCNPLTASANGKHDPPPRKKG